MKALLAALAILAATPTLAADKHAGHNHAAPAAATLVDGTVKKVDKTAGKLTLSHGPLPNGMPAMTMAFGVKNPAWLDQLKAGDKIRFGMEDTGGVLTVTRIERP
ncbi:copper-binding protein [uncultured Zoogloea sp.]|uniref:copper-binding protein n=1 Tax=uncultured Zoogloea sp. TaxID=160237 RepID=UPI0026120375|nr:copper-binding protein [uncultured Zoogloea sp.]